MLTDQERWLLKFVVNNTPEHRRQEFNALIDRLTAAVGSGVDVDTSDLQVYRDFAAQDKWTALQVMTFAKKDLPNLIDELEKHRSLPPVEPGAAEVAEIERENIARTAAGAWGIDYDDLKDGSYEDQRDSKYEWLEVAHALIASGFGPRLPSFEKMMDILASRKIAPGLRVGIIEAVTAASGFGAGGTPGTVEDSAILHALRFGKYSGRFVDEERHQLAREILAAQAAKGDER